MKFTRSRLSVMGWYCILPLIALLCLPGCGKKSKINPFDPDDPDYQKPQIRAVSLMPYDTLDIDTCRVGWEGNHKECQFRYRFDPSEAWSQWSTASSLVEVLADGVFQLQISARFGSLPDTSLVTVPFTVLTLIEPAIFLYPQKQVVTASQPQATYTVKSVGLDSCNAMSISFSGAKVTSATLPSSLASGANALFTDTLVTLFWLDSAQSHYIVDDMSFLFVTLAPPADKDTAQVTIAVTGAKKVGVTQDTVHIETTKGGFIIQQ